MAQSIEQLFTLALFEAYRKAKTEAKYNATKFYSMLNDNGGIATAKTLINASKPSDGYTALYQRGRLDLTVEAIVVEDLKWYPLFTEVEIARSRKRLSDYHYTPKSW